MIGIIASEVFGIFLEGLYRLFGYIIYGPKFLKEEKVPSYIKVIAWTSVLIFLGAIIWLLIYIINLQEN